MRGWWILVLPTTAAIACAAGYYQTQRVDPEFEPVPVSVMPAIDGVEVIRSKGFKGNDCCEPHPGSRQVMLETGRLPVSDALALVESELRAAGWYEAPCQSSGRMACLRTGDYFAFVGSSAHDRPARADVEVYFERAESNP